MKKNNKFTVKDVQKVLINPFYCTTIHESLSLPHEPIVSKEDWIKINVIMIEGGGPDKPMGAKKWLKLLLEILEGKYLA